MISQNKYPSMKDDFVFKFVMRSKKVLSGFLAAILKIQPHDITDIQYRNTVTLKTKKNDKYGIMDIFITINNQQNINIEMQKYTAKYWTERSLFYNFKNYIDQMESGSINDNTLPCIHIGILDFNLYKKNQSYHQCFMLKSLTSNMLYTDKIAFHVIELKKQKYTKDEDKDDLFKWIQIINSETREEIALIARANEQMEEALKQLDILNQDEEIRRIYWKKKVQLYIDHKAKKEAYEAAIKQRDNKLIKENLEKGYSLQQIADFLGEPYETIKERASVNGEIFRRAFLNESE